MALETPVINLTYKRGDSHAIAFLLSDSVTGNPLDLTGYTVPVLAVNTEEEPTDITNQLFTVSGTVVSPETDGKISFSPTTVDSDQTPSDYFYDAQVLDASGGKRTFVRGSFTITQDIAKD